ncbi:synaptotagmin-1-like isoform X2 [Babylonia areolata]|uniref:synaptotagmin-1-like isoform X2 n=1 Tax=Babylonia areolata TaxID=304850 RepID=UPI003FD02B54
MTYLLILDIWDKLAIVAVAMLFLFLVLVVVVCIVSPHCWLNQFCPCSDVDDLRKPPPAYGAIEYGSDVELHSVKQPLHPDHHRPPGYWPNLRSIKESETSDGMSDPGFSERIELKRASKSKRTPSVRSSDSSSSGSTIHTFPLKDATLSYTLTFDMAEGKLHIKVKQLAGVRVSDPDGVMAPYVKVRVYRSPKQFWSFRHRSGREHLLNNLDVEMTTKIQRRVDDPCFNETFTVECEHKNLANLCLRFLVCDFDRYQRHVVVGEVVREVGKVQWPPEMELDFCQHLQQPVEEDLGQLHVGLMYLPTSEKLNLLVMSAEGLKVVETQKHPAECFIKITLMHDGRPMKKTKTASHPNEVSPSFNESFTFDVPTDQLEKVYFTLSALHVDQDGKRHLIGRCYIGLNFDPEAREQWAEMVQSPRKQVTCWHRLQC